MAVEASGGILVIDLDAGTDSKGALFRVHPAQGTREVLSNFGDPGQGTLGDNLLGVAAVEPSGEILVINPAGGVDAKGGALFRVDPASGARRVLSD